MMRLVSRRIALLSLGLTALVALALGLWLGAFQAQRALAHPLDLYVTVTSDPTSGAVAQGSIITYTVTVTSDGATSAAGGNITLNVDLSGLTLVTGSISGTGISCTGTDPLACQVDNFSDDSSKTVVFRALVLAGGPALVGAALDPPIDGLGVGEVDEGTASPDTALDDGDEPSAGPNCTGVGEGNDPENTEEDNFDCTEHTVGTANLTITKAASTPVEDSVVGAGAAISYNITVTNAGPAAVGGVVIRDFLDADLTFSSITPPGADVTCESPINPADGVDCTVASLASGASRTLAMSATVKTSATGDIFNGAKVNPDGRIVETNDEADDPAQDCPTVGEIAGGSVDPDNFDCTRHRTVDLTITKTASPAETSNVDTGDTITYTLTVRNESSSSATPSNVTIRDWLGTGLTFVSIAPGAGSNGTGVTCNDTTAPYDCTAASIPPGESRTVTLVARVLATSGAVRNGARVDPDPGTVAETNEDADDPTLNCGTTLGEGTDAGADNERDNYDCTEHDVGAAATPSPTPSPTPTATPTRTLTLSPRGWHNFVWTGATGTAPETALNCIAGQFQIAYEWVGLLQDFRRYVPSMPTLSNMDPLTQYDSLFVLITTDNVICTMPLAP